VKIAAATNAATARAIDIGDAKAAAAAAAPAAATADQARATAATAATTSAAPTQADITVKAPEPETAGAVVVEVQNTADPKAPGEAATNAMNLDAMPDGAAAVTEVFEPPECATVMATSDDEHGVSAPAKLIPSELQEDTPARRDAGKRRSPSTPTTRGRHQQHRGRCSHRGWKAALSNPRAQLC